MSDAYDRFENEKSSGGSFVMGLLTGTVLGAGLGMLFAPKAGSELRGQIGERAGNLANTASEQYRRATEAAGDLADRGREMYDKARDAVAKGTDEAQKYVRDVSSSVTGAPAHSTGGGSSHAESGSGRRNASEYAAGPSGPGTTGTTGMAGGGSHRS